MSEHSLKIEQLVKEWLKSGDHVVPDELHALLHSRVHSERVGPFTPKFLERYEQGSLSLHFHISSQLSVCTEEETVGECLGRGEWCVVAETSALFYDCNLFRADAVDNLSVVSYDSGEIERSVFINVLKFVEDVETVIPTRVGLQTLHECNRLNGNTCKFVFPRTQEGTWTGSDQECAFSPRLSCAVPHDELPYKVIQSGSQVEKEVPQNDTEHRVRSRGEAHHKESRTIGVLLSDEFTRTSFEIADDAQGTVKMFLCPDQFQRNTFQTSVCHEDNLQQKSRKFK